MALPGLTSSFNEFEENPCKPRFLDKAKNALKEVGTFIYETPLWVVASAVAGIAMLFFFPPFAAPLLGLAGAVVLSRLIIKIIDINKPELLKSFKEKLYEFQQKRPYIQLLAFVVALIVTIWCPIGGFILAAPAGLYKGLIVEIDVNRTKQHIRLAELQNPIPDSFVGIVDC